MVEPGPLRDVTRPLPVFRFIISDALWSQDGCSTVSFPSGSSQNKEERKQKRKGRPLYTERAKRLQQSLAELPSAYYLELSPGHA